MRVFLSWSGRKSHEIALALKEWLPEVINDLKPWMSSEDIDKGANWGATIARELEQSNFGIICLTRENQDRVWLNYEAGAIAKAMSGETAARAATFLIDIESDAEVTGPLFQFQSTKPVKDDVLKLVKSLNTAAGSPRTDDQLKRSVEMWWPELEKAISHANRPELVSPVEPVRTQGEVLDEVLLRVREIARDVNRVNWGHSVEVGVRGSAWRGAAPGLQERVQLSTRDAMERDLSAIANSLGYPLEHMYQVDGGGGGTTLIIQGEYPAEVTESIQSAAVQRGLHVSFRSGIIAAPDDADSPDA